MPALAEAPLSVEHKTPVRGFSAINLEELGDQLTSHRTGRSYDWWKIRDADMVLRVRTDRLQGALVPGVGHAAARISAFHHKNLEGMSKDPIVGNPHVQVEVAREAVEKIPIFYSSQEDRVYIPGKASRADSKTGRSANFIAKEALAYSKYIHEQSGYYLEYARLELGVDRQGRIMIIGELFTPETSVIKDISTGENVMHEELLESFTHRGVSAASPEEIKGAIVSYFRGS